MSVTESQGIELQRADESSPEVFQLVSRVVGFDGPGGSASEIDASDLSSQAKEFIIGLRDEGTFSFDFNKDLDSTTQQGLRSDRANRVLRNFRLVFNNDSPSDYVEFSAFVMEYRISGGVDQLVKGKCTLRISGPLTWSMD